MPPQRVPLNAVYILTFSLRFDFEGGGLFAIAFFNVAVTNQCIADRAIGKCDDVPDTPFDVGRTAFYGWRQADTELQGCIGNGLTIGLIAVPQGCVWPGQSHRLIARLCTYKIAKGLAVFVAKHTILAFGFVFKIDEFSLNTLYGLGTYTYRCVHDEGIARSIQRTGGFTGQCNFYGITG